MNKVNKSTNSNIPTFGITKIMKLTIVKTILKLKLIITIAIILI